MSEKSLLKIEDLYIKYHTVDNEVCAVNGVDLELKKGEAVGLVGETGAGKTTTALSILGLLPKGVGEVYRGSITFKDTDIINASEKELRDIRGAQISMIFQDPMTSLNPVFTVGEQIAEVLELHGTKQFRESMEEQGIDIRKRSKYDSGMTKEEIDARVDEILTLVGIESSRKICYPHQLSGGMKQRIVIAMALACDPDLIIADEPTTALDVTIQSQVLSMIDDIQKRYGTSLIMITHDFGVVAETCDKVAIMYAGEIIEFGTLEQIFDRSRAHHPYTVGLFNSIPDLSSEKERLEPIAGLTPDPAHLPSGCYFSPRCPKCMEICRQKSPSVTKRTDGQIIKCHLYCDSGKAGEE